MKEPPSSDKDRAFQIRCACKRGQYVAANDIQWVHSICKKFPEWYASQDRRIYEATAPYGTFIQQKE